MTTSCLDAKIVDTTLTDKYYKTELHAQNAILGVYSYLYAFNYHKVNWPMVMAAMEDAMFVTSTGVPESMSNNTHSATTGPAINFWGSLYGGINAANEVLERVPGIAFDDENDRGRILAEAHFLRAMYHYDAVRLYGGIDGVPIKIKAAQTMEDAYTEVSPASAVYQFIIEELEYAAGTNEDGTLRLPLYKNAVSDVGRATNGSARALLADVYNTMGRWEDAIANADIVINSSQYRLLDNYADLWDVEKEALSYNEHILVVPFFRDLDAVEDSSLGSQAARFYCPNGINEDGSNLSGNVYGKGEGTYRVQKWFIRYFQDDQGNLGYSDGTKDASSTVANLTYKDYRIETSFFRKFLSKNNETGVTGNKTAYPAAGSGQDNWGYIKKYIDPKGISNRTNENNIVRLRLSDMYLIKAEAYNELGQYDKACQAIDMVRERARKANGAARVWPKFVGSDRTDNIGRTLSKDEFRWLVFMERGLEFAGEQKRWFDLKRMKKDDTQMMYDYMMTTFIPGRPGGDIQSNWAVLAERKKWLPKPYNEVQRNPHVKQNPGF
ncbi:hypothetical protein FACS1894159_11380 [Bacteroidia bacterium]|nr:hypothetical protein FACS1894159_11380 [Bacteroidia bacterium]